MRRIVGIVLVLVCIASSVFAQDEIRRKVFVFEIANSTGDYQSSVIPSSIITTGSRILGLCVVKNDLTLNWESVVGLHDSITDAGELHAEVIAEAEVQDNESGNKWFFYPLTIETSLRVNQGANTKVLIYYNR